MEIIAEYAQHTELLQRASRLHDAFLVRPEAAERQRCDRFVEEDVPFSAYEVQEVGRGWSRLYVNECFRCRAHVNTQALGTLVAWEGLEDEALPTVWDVSDTLCGRSGLRPILSVVSVWHDLQSVSFRGCSLDSGSISHMATLLKGHRSLQEIDLRDNPIYASGGRLLVELARNSPRLLRIKTPETIPSNFQSRITARLHANLMALKRRYPERYLFSSDVDSNVGVVTGVTLDKGEPPEYYEWLGLSSSVLAYDGWSGSEVCDLLPGLVKGRACFEAEMRSLAERWRFRPNSILAQQLADLREAVSQIDTTADLFNTPKHSETLRLYGHVRRAFSSLARGGGGGGPRTEEPDPGTILAAQLTESVEIWLRNDFLTTRCVINLLERVKYHLIFRGARANRLLTKWLKRTKAEVSPLGIPLRECFVTVYEKAVAASEYGAQEVEERGVLLGEMRRVFPKCVTAFLLHVTLAGLFDVDGGDGDDSLRMVSQQLRAVLTGGRDGVSPAEDLPASIPRRDFLCHAYDLFGVQQSATQKVEEMHAWLRLLPIKVLEGFLEEETNTEK